MEKNVWLLYRDVKESMIVEIDNQYSYYLRTYLNITFALFLKKEDPFDRKKTKFWSGLDAYSRVFIDSTSSSSAGQSILTYMHRFSIVLATPCVAMPKIKGHLFIPYIIISWVLCVGIYFLFFFFHV